jgi:hypothetical protein
MTEIKSSGHRRKRRWWVLKTQEQRFWIFGLVMGLMIMYFVISASTG